MEPAPTPRTRPPDPGTPLLFPRPLGSENSRGEGAESRVAKRQAGPGAW